MADGTRTTSGDRIWTEDTGDTRGKIPRSKIAIGNLDADNGDASQSNRFPVNAASVSLPLCGTLLATTTAAALPQHACTEVLIQNDPAGANDVLAGNSSAQTIVLKPGAFLSLEITDASSLYVKSVSGSANVNYLARS